MLMLKADVDDEEEVADIDIILNGNRIAFISNCVK